MNTPALNDFQSTARMVAEFLESGDYDNARMALNDMARLVTRVRNEIAAITAPILTPEERAARERARAIKDALQEGRAAGLKDAELWGDKDVLTFNPYMDVQLHEAWQEGYEQGRVVPF